MNPELQHCDLRTLLDIYLKESKKFSTALEEGVGWQTLQEKRQYIRAISTLINKKYDELYGAHRFRNRPPHGD